MIEIYCDGSAKRNPGPGGWGLLVLKEKNVLKTKSMQYKQAITNNQMELCALLTALHLASTEYKNEWVTIYCDSAYCVNMCNSWIFTWSQNGWQNSKKQQVENYELVTAIWDYIQFPVGKWTIKKCSGHCGIVGNELADALATNNQEKFNKILKENKLLYDNEENFDKK